MNSDYTATVVNNKLKSFIHVLVINDENSRQTIVLDQEKYSIGRDPRNTIALSSKKVSRIHGTILRRDDAQNKSFSYWLLDGDLKGTRSTNGIFINNKRCLVQELKHEDLIRFGQEVEASYYLVSDVSELTALQSQDYEADPVSEPTSIPDYKMTQTAEKFETLVISEPMVELFEESQNAQKDEELSKLASFPEWSPNPIIEIDWSGKITYVNPAATKKFPELKKDDVNGDHPLLLGLVKSVKNHGSNPNLFVREIEIRNQIFEEYIHYLPDQKLIRCYIFDYTKRKVLENQIKQTETRYKKVLNQTKEGIFLVDADDKKVLEANNSFADLLGYGLDEIHCLKLYDLLHLTSAQIDERVSFLVKNKDSQEESNEVLSFLSKDQATVNLESCSTLIVYGDQKIISFTVRPPSVDGRGGETVIQQDQGLFDLETGLPNRYLFMEQLNTAIANTHRSQGLLCLMFVELELDKKVNESNNYRLKLGIFDGFSKRLRSSLRSGDTVARWQGNQFVCLLPQVRNFKDIGKVSDRILDTLKPPFFLDNQKIYVKTSMGIAIYGEENNTSSLILSNSQSALNKSKECGSNNYKFCEIEIEQEIQRLLRLEKLLFHALDKKEFSLSYQPIFDANTHECAGIEALLRWRHPELGPVLPHQFMPLAEETGLIIPIGEWVLEKACFQHNIWLKNNVVNKPIHVNISAQQLQQSDFINMVSNVLNKTELDPSFLVLEVTEEIISSDLELAQKTFTELNQMGVKICLDDFGKGMSAVGYLKQFEFHSIKIDTDIVQHLADNGQDLAIVSAIINIGKNFNLSVVAEGIETKAQLELLSSLGCDQVQGNLFSEPLKMDDATNFLANPSYTFN